MRSGAADVAALLVDLRLDQFADGLAGALGVTSLADLAGASDDALLGIGFKKGHIRKLRLALAGGMGPLGGRRGSGRVSRSARSMARRKSRRPSASGPGRHIAEGGGSQRSSYHQPKKKKKKKKKKKRKKKKKGKKTTKAEL